MNHQNLVFCFAFRLLIRNFAFKLQQMNPTNTLIIRIGHDALTFLASDIEGQPIYKTYEMKGGMSVAANLREAFKTMPMLGGTWEKVIVMADVPVMLVPEEEFDAADADLLFSHAFSGHERDVKIHHQMESLRAVALYAVERDVQTAVSDHCKDADYLPVALPLWEHVGTQTEGTRQRLYGYFHDGKADVFSFSKQRFRFCNTFSAVHAHDALFYLLSTFTQLGMKGDRDEVMVMGSTPHLKWVADNLRAYVSRVSICDAETMQISSPVSRDIPLDICAYLQHAQS